MAPSTFWVAWRARTAVVVDQVGGDRGGLVVVARVVHQPGEGLVRELLGPDEVATPQLERVDADLLGECVHRPLDRIGRLRAAGAAVRVGRGERGEHAGAGEVVGLRQVVDAGVEERSEQRDAGRDQLQVGAHVGGESHPHGGELAAGVGGQLDVLDLAATLDAGHGVLRAGLVPAHRRPSLRASATHSSSSAYTSSLAPKPPPTAGAITRSWCSGTPSVTATITLSTWGIWVAVYSVMSPPNGCGIADDGARLHRHRDQSLLDVAFADGVRGVVEGLLDGAVGLLDEQVPGVRRVGAELGMHQDAVRQRVLEFGDRFERLVGDVDRLDRVVGDRVAVGEHDRHAVTDVVDAYRWRSDGAAG